MSNIKRNKLAEPRELFSVKRKRIQPNRIPKKLFLVMETIYKEFAEIVAIPYRDRPRDKMYLPARATSDALQKKFAQAKIRVSYHLLIKAKNALGIRTIHVGSVKSGEYIWYAPTHSPSQVMNLIRSSKERAFTLRQEEKDSIRQTMRENARDNHWAVKDLREFMISSSYWVTAVEARSYWQENYPRNRQTLFDAKRYLKIKSIKREEGWYWVYPAPEIRDWLISRLEKGPVAVETLKKEGDEVGWGYEVLHQAKIAAEGIHDLFLMKRGQRVRYWFDAGVNPDLVEGESDEETDSN